MDSQGGEEVWRRRRYISVCLLPCLHDCLAPSAEKCQHKAGTGSYVQHVGVRIHSWSFHFLFFPLTLTLPSRLLRVTSATYLLLFPFYTFLSISASISRLISLFHLLLSLSSSSSSHFLASPSKSATSLRDRLEHD